MHLTQQIHLTALRAQSGYRLIMQGQDLMSTDFLFSRALFLYDTRLIGILPI